MTFPAENLHLAVDLVMCAIGAGGWCLFQIFRMTQDREMRNRRGRKGRLGGRKGGRSYGGGSWRSEVAIAPDEEPSLVLALRDRGVVVNKVGSSVQDLDNDSDPEDDPRWEPPVKKKLSPQISSLDSILNPSRKYRLPEAK